jgi:hypothetical protein
MKIRFLITLFLGLIASTGYGQYLETFSTPNKGYLENFVNDFNGVNWTLTPWANQPPAEFGRDDQDYFKTTAAGVLQSIDLDQEVCWLSPLLVATVNGTAAFTADITWAGYDAGQTNPQEYINVEYRINGGSWVRHPNVLGANGDPAFTVRYTAVGGSGSHTTNFPSIAILVGHTFEIRICVSNNLNAEVVTIDNVSVTNVQLASACLQPTVSTVVTPTGSCNPNTGAITVTASNGTPGYHVAWSGPSSGNPAGTEIATSGGSYAISPLAAGLYSITVTDAVGCSTTTSATVSTATALALSTIILNANCPGEASGEIDLIVNNGVPPYSYSWNNLPGSPDPQDQIGLTPNTYTVTVTDAAGCTASTSAVVGVAPTGAYLETFSVNNKGYLPDFVDDFVGVNWTLSSWNNQPPAAFGRVAADFFRTAGGVLTATDLDQEVCWISPLINIQSAAAVASAQLTWTGLDNDAAEYIKFEYSIDGGAFVQVPNVVGGGTNTIQYTAGLDNNGSTTVSTPTLSGTSLRIRICGNINSNTEFFTIDNVSVPQAVSLCFGPANDLCANATNLTCGATNTGDIGGATATGAPTGCAGGGTPQGGIWFTFVGTGQLTTVSTAGSSFNTQLNIYTGTCGALSCVAGDDDSGPGNTSEVVFCAASGVTYYIYLDSDVALPAGTYSISVSCVPVAPSIATCQSNITTGTDPDLCTALESFSATAVGCPAPTVTFRIGATVITSPYPFPIGTTTVDVTASNGISPDATCSFTVMVTDTQAPDITCLVGTQMRGTNLGNCSYTVQGTEFNPTVNENCPGFTLTNDFNNTNTLAGAVLPTGTTTVVWTIADGANATDMCTVTIQVTDDDAPTLTCPAATSTPCNIADLPPYASLTEFTDAGGSASDNCGINAASFMLLSQTGGPLSFVRTYQIADINGLTATCTQTVTVNDDEPPMITPGTIAACYPTVAAAEAAAIAATMAVDGCPGEVTKTASTVGTCMAVITVTATDGASNSASVTYNTRIDNMPPTVTQGMIAACYPTVAAAEAAALAATSATDNCPGALTETASTVGTCSAVITVTTTDMCGNSAQVTYNTSIDNESPTVTTGTIAACYPTVAAAEAAAIAATTVMDDCPSNIVKTASTTGTCSAVVTVTATDACGNSATTTYNTRIDNTPPTPTAGSIAACYQTVAAAEAAALAATSATDNCDGPLTETVSTVGTCSAVITVTTTDGCGNSASVTYNTRIDNTPPTVTTGTIAACYPTVAAAEAAALAATTATDNCDGPLTEIAVTTNEPGCVAVIVVTVTDGCGNGATATYTTRIDNTAPVITPGTIAACYPTVAAAEAAAIAATTAVDACPGTVTKTASTSGTCTALVTVTATDACGNSDTFTYSTRIDNTPPTVTQGTIAACYPTVAAAEAAALAATSATDNCPGPLTETASTVGTCSAVVTVTTTDGCGNSASVTYNTRIDNAGPTVMTGTIAACYPTVAAAEAAAIAATTAMDDCPSSVTKTASTAGTCSAVVTVTATDGCGNSASTTYNTRIDNTPPTVTAGSIAACYPTVAAAEAAALAATSATDNCDGPLTETVSTVGTCMAVVTVTTTDGCGNSASVTYNTRIDNTPPMVTQGTIAACFPTVAAAEAAALAATSATDNCPGTLSETASTVGTCSAVVTVTTTDGCGNSASVTYNTRIDNTPPMVTPGTIAPCYPTVAAAEAAAIAATTATDNCPGTVIKTASTVGLCAATVTVTATDFCGNSATTTYTTNIDNTPPTVTAGAIGPYYPTIAAAEAAAIAATTAMDNCPGTLTYSASTEGECAVVVTVTVADACGNSASVTYQTTVDNEPPTADCLNPTIVFNGQQMITFDADDVVIADDNCGIQSIGLSSNAVTCEQLGQVVPVIVTVTDFVGLTATCTSNVTVGGLPCGWSQNPDGVGCANGNNIAYNPGTGVWTATSTNCFYGPNFTSDATAFAQRTLCGDGSITAQVTGISGTALGWAGVVMRESNAAGAKKAH